MKTFLIHPIGYEQRPRGHEPDHYEDIEKCLRSRGHTLLPPTAASVASIDVMLVDLNVWNLAVGTSPYDAQVMDQAISRRVPIVWFEPFDHGGNEHSEGGWPGANNWHDCDINPQHDFYRRIGQSAKSCRILYFMRKMQIHANYPKCVYPLEYPIFEEYSLATKEELLHRPFDVCGLANLSYPRGLSFLGLQRDKRIKADCEIIPDYRRLSHDAWIARHRQAKFFIEADASLGSERPMRLMTVAAMLRIKSDHRIPFPRRDMVHQVEIGDWDGFIRPQDIDKLLLVLNNPDLLYSIYVQGAEHMKKYYSRDARASYAVDLIEKFVSGSIP